MTVFKKIAKNVTTFLILVGLYFAYARGFRVLRWWVGYESPVLVDREIMRPRKSPTAIEKTRLATKAFGEGHWTTDPDLPISYYYVDRGYWIYSKRLKRLNNGQRILLRPFAMIWKSKDSDKLQTATADEAILDLDQPMGSAKKVSDQSGHVSHAKLEGNVLLRDDKGTVDPADDLRIGPLGYIEFDDSKLQIYTDERVVLFDGIEHKVEGTGLLIDLWPRDQAPPRPGVPTSQTSSSNSGFSGAKTIWLNKQVAVLIRDVGNSGILPGSSRDPKAGPIPLRVKSEGAMRIDMPKPAPPGPPVQGPPAPAEPIVVQFQRNVEVQRGLTYIDQLNSDTLLLLLNPAGAPQTGTKQTSTSNTLGNLELRWAKATGHAVWLQSQAQDMIAHGNELIYDKPGKQRPDKIYLSSNTNKRLWIEKLERDDKRKVTAIHWIRTFDVTIYDDGKPGGPQSIVSRGPGILETRPARDKDVERTFTWEDEFVMNPAMLGKQVLKQVVLKGNPSIDDVLQGRLDAKSSIVALLEPITRDEPKANDKPDKKGATGKKNEPQTATPKKPKETTKDQEKTTPTSSSAASFRIVRLEAFDNAHMISSGRDLTAIDRLYADFEKPPEPKVEDSKKTEAGALAKADGKGVPAGEEDKAKKEGPDQKNEAKPEPPPPKVTAIAQRIDAKILQAPGATKGEVDKARLYGDVQVHQDPKQGEARGNDVSGQAVDLASQGEGLMRFQVHRYDPRRKKEPDLKEQPPATVDTSDQRHLEGDLIVVDQKLNRLDVPSPGKLIMISENDILADPKPAKSEKDRSETDTQNDRPEPTKTAPPPKTKTTTITWNSGMTFLGMPTFTNGNVGTAVARFLGSVVAVSEDSRILTDDMETDFDQPISFAKVVASAPLPEKKEKGQVPEEPKPKPEILQVRCRGSVDIRSWTKDEKQPIISSQKQINGSYVIYDKPSGHFWVEGKGIVRLYDRDDSSLTQQEKPSNGPTAKVPPRGNQPQAKPARNSNPQKRTRRTSAPPRERAAQAQPPLVQSAVLPLTLTRIQFEQGMEGRFRVPGSPQADTEPRQADFFEQVEMLRAIVEDEHRDLDPDRPPQDLIRLTSDVLEVQSLPNPRTTRDSPKPKDSTYEIAIGNAIASTNERVIKADRITHSSVTGLIYCYPAPGGEVLLQERKNFNHEPSIARGKILKYNHVSKEIEWADPSGVRLFKKEGGRLSVPGPILKRPPPPKKRFRQLTPSDKERQSFNGA